MLRLCRSIQFAKREPEIVIGISGLRLNLYGVRQRFDSALEVFACNAKAPEVHLSKKKLRPFTHALNISLFTLVVVPFHEKDCAQFGPALIIVAIGSEKLL